MSFISLNKSLRGIRFRLTLVYSTLFGLFICIFAYILTTQFTRTIEDDFNSALLNFAIDVSDQVKIESNVFPPPLHLTKKSLKKHFPFIRSGTYFSLRNLNGDILQESRSHQPEIPYNPELGQDEFYTHRFQTIQNKKNTFRAVNLKIFADDENPLILQVATPTTKIEEQENRIILINLITIPLLILISSLASYIIAGNALSPIKLLTETTNRIAAQNLSLRVPVIETGDEVEELSKTLNTLLERLQKAFEAQDHFVSNASHQLNTPLAIIKGELDVLEAKIRTPEDHQKFHKSLREEVERLIELVKNMLLISRVEAGKENFVFRPQRLDEILMGIISRLNPKARDKKIQIRFNISEELSEKDEISIQGEKQLLDSLFENILDNAIKYGPDGSVVTITMEGKENRTIVSIQDEGPGITPQEFEKILSKRFQRGTRVIMPGTGIGLSIAFKIAEHHQAQISYEKLRTQGSRFTIGFTK